MLPQQTASHHGHCHCISSRSQLRFCIFSQHEQRTPHAASSQVTGAQLPCRYGRDACHHVCCSTWRSVLYPGRARFPGSRLPLLLVLASIPAEVWQLGIWASRISQGVLDSRIPSLSHYTSCRIKSQATVPANPPFKQGVRLQLSGVPNAV